MPHEEQREQRDRPDRLHVSLDRLHIDIHHHADPRTDEMFRLFGCILENQRTIMATLSTFQELLAAMNTVTNTIATNIQTLLDRLSTAGLTDAEEATVIAGLEAQVAALQAVAASSANPVPPVPTPPTP